MKTSVTISRSARTLEIETAHYKGALVVKMQPHYADEAGVMRRSGMPIWVPAAALPRLIKALTDVNEALLDQGRSR
ncbi:hypothetical protein [Burkholderia pseudomallei]|uniref:hypothetical protein n=1 Tax=Burkholderia pseudomallei TaxID=28450 RepID=UPI0007BEE0DE|nr:hypothetical protein [Burkholderia pseudomallei]OAB13676.1 hypothetical protein AQ853_28210 [Burkholderia pseudomallei]